MQFTSLHGDRLLSSALRRNHVFHSKVSCRKSCMHVTTEGRPRAPRSQRPPQQHASGAGADSPSKAHGRPKLDIWKNQLAKLSSNPRAVAVAQLMRVEEEGAFVGLVGGSPNGEGSQDEQDDAVVVARNWREKLSDRDARLVTELVSGVTRWRRRLDYIICHLTKTDDLAELDAPLRQLLRMGLYELLELGAPSHVINEHVQLTKRVINTGAGGFANGVLRNSVRLIEAKRLPRPTAPPPDADTRVHADALGIAASHPTWLVERWLHRMGRLPTLDLLKWNNSRPAHSLRVSPSLAATPAQLCTQLVKSGVTAAPSAYLPQEFLKVESGLQALLATGLVAQGKVQVQDEAAGLVVAMLDPQPGETVLDACAAPGGKTLFAAARMGGRGRILALDVSAPRLQALAGTAQRQGYSGIVNTHAADFRRLAGGPQEAQLAHEAAAGGGGALRQNPVGEQQQAQQGAGGSAGAVQALLRSQFDRVLLDVPCSGTGVLAKRADLRWRRQPGDLRQLAALQDALLDAAAPWVKPGGLLVYSTCSIEPEENQQRVGHFLAAHPDFVVEPPPAGVGVPGDCLTEEGFLRMLPHVHATDGAFAARLRRRG